MIKLIKNILTLFLATSFVTCLAQAIIHGDGGGDSGGGSGVIQNGQLRLKDFAECPTLNANLNTSSIESLKKEVITSRLSILDSKALKDLIKKDISIKNPILEKLVWAAAARAKWYSVDSELTVSHEQQNMKLALFKRSVGVLFNQNLIAQLSPTDHLGLIVHETLRMISLGFKMKIKTSALEKLNCQIFSNQEIDLSAYPEIDQYFKSIENTDSVLKKLEAMSELQDIKKTNASYLKYFFYQLDYSRFEIFRHYSPTTQAQKLEQVFFNWATQEVSPDCTDQNSCSYSEEWPAVNQNNVTELQKWNLLYNQSDALAWFNTENRIGFAISKSLQSYDEALAFCAHKSQQLNLNLKLVNQQTLKNLQKINSIAFLLNRKNPNSMDETLEIILGGPAEKRFAWLPQIKSTYQMIYDDWKISGRAMCVSE